MMRKPARSCGSGSPARPRFGPLLPLLLILSLAVNVIDCVRVESRSAGITRVLQRRPRRNRGARKARS